MCLIIFIPGGVSYGSGIYLYLYNPFPTPLE